MPEMHVRLRWPDGGVERIYSPSLVLVDHVEEGATYPVAELRDRLSRALDEAGQRVRASHGFACPRAAASRKLILQRAGCFAAEQHVVVEAFER